MESTNLVTGVGPPESPPVVPPVVQPAITGGLDVRHDPEKIDEAIRAYLGPDDQNDYQIPEFNLRLFDEYLSGVESAGGTRQGADVVVHEVVQQLEMLIYHDELVVVDEDITCGREVVAVPLVSPKVWAEDKSRPPRFRYTRSNVVGGAARLAINVRGSGVLICNCTGSCSTENCECVRGATMRESPYNDGRLLTDEFLKRACSAASSIAMRPPFIKECSVACFCPTPCGNKVVQRGVCHKFEVVKAKPGYVLRNVEYIVPGEFLFELTGEILNGVEVKERVDCGAKLEEMYGFVVDAAPFSVNCLEPLFLDFTDFGNLSRFIQRRTFEQANCIAVTVYIEGLGINYNHVGIFSKIHMLPRTTLVLHLPLIDYNTLVPSKSPIKRNERRAQIKKEGSGNKKDVTPPKPLNRPSKRDR